MNVTRQSGGPWAYRDPDRPARLPQHSAVPPAGSGPVAVTENLTTGHGQSGGSVLPAGGPAPAPAERLVTASGPGGAGNGIPGDGGPARTSSGPEPVSLTRYLQ